MSASVPPNEVERLQALYDYEVLETEPEEAFDDLARLAANICGTPIAVVSLVDKDRVWFKAAIGLDDKEWPRNAAPCAVAVLKGGEIFVVEDLSQQGELEKMRALNPKLPRFYAAAPLINPQGFALGTLCVAGPEARKLSEDQAEALGILARQVVAQLELRRSVRRLEEQSKELTSALKAAEASNHAKSTFLANMSHEVRTPLNGVIGMAEILASTPLSERQRRYADAIRRSGEGLLGILNDVLEVAQSESSGELSLVDLTIPSLLDELVGMMQTAAESKKLWIDLQVDPQLRGSVLADALRLRQVLTSLLANAIKFTHKGWIQVRATLVEETSTTRKVRFDVQDSGIGISSERLAAIFGQPDGGTEVVRLAGGGGVGLPLSQRMVRAMGGELNVQSQPDAGSTFSFTLNLEISDGHGRHRPKRVLVVEDNEVNSLVITAMLEQNGCAVECVENGAVAVELLRRERFDMVFMDLHMPEMDGVTATRQVRAWEGAGEHTPIVAVTASAFTEEETRCREAGMDGLIRKPINERLVREALSKYASAV